MKGNSYYFFLLILWIIGFGCSESTRSYSSAERELPDNIDFNFHVRPILSDRCYACHGPDEKTREAGLRLDVKAGAFTSLDSTEERYAIVAGDVEHSQLLYRINSDDPDEIMPPPDSKLSLSEREKKILRRWIEQGAEWKEHWAFIAPQEQIPPNISKPKRANNEIDHFILDRLDREGLKPAKRATKEKLIRRLSFDLRGIPPTIKEIDSFLADNDPNAYEKLVDAFLASSHYGERLALEWLDLARYADSHGYQDDLERTMWPWRDWVIQAFNQNLPYDDFVKWQLAGDLYPDPSYEQILATGFNRNHKITQEVGVVNEEYRVEYVLDRVNTFSTAFLGLTVACAQCHDHKFDPISQQEFYSLYSFFNSVPEQGRVDYGMKIAEPSLPLPDSVIDQQTQYIQELVRQQEKRVDQYEEEKWQESTNAKIIQAKYADRRKDLPGGWLAYYPFDYIENGSTLDEKGGQGAKIINGPVPRQGKFSGAFDFNGENHLELERVPGLNLGGPFTVSFWMYSVENGARGTILGSQSPRDGLKAEFELNASDDGFQLDLQRVKSDNSTKKRLAVRTTHILPGNEWVHIAITYDGSNKGSGVKLFLNGEAQKLNISKDELGSAPTIRGPLIIGKRFYKRNFRSNPSGLFRARLDEFLLYGRTLSEAEVQQLAAFDPIAQLEDKPNKNTQDHKRLFYHKLHHKDPNYQRMTQWLSEYKYREMRTEHLILKPTMVMADMDTARHTFILERGQYNAPTKRVYPGTPSHVLYFPEDLPKNRLGLAQWLFQEDHPLTARVAVNRYWQLLFGRGLVTTPEDFGSQGDLPSHPELLDWLALTFRNSGWDTKALLKTIVMSATYQQAAVSNAKVLQRDPDNMLLARGPQIRLQAELVRDHALAISGLLSDQIGGPSVKPYQPKGLWLQVASGNQELKEYIQDHGAELYRKSMYTFWKRSLPPPSMITFDASTREQCAVEREHTSTPMQALVLLNDPQFTEASRQVAQRMLVEGGNAAGDRIRFAFRLATSRQPNKQELKLLQQLLLDQQKVFEEDPGKAKDLLDIGEYPYDLELDLVELASYTVIANAILNLTETTRKG